MANKHSAALLPYRIQEGVLEVFIAHMGGPFWAKRDQGGWSVAKGEYDPNGELSQAAAHREFFEEIGVNIEEESSLLGEFKQPSGKVITVYVVDYSDKSLEFVKSNNFEIEWPKGSGKTSIFPEVDKAQWHTGGIAMKKLVKGQVAIIEELQQQLSEYREVALFSPSSQESLF